LQQAATLARAAAAPARTATRQVNPWVVTLSVMLATFMEILDTTVVNVSIPHIAGNMSATVEEGTWVVTSYLVANAIILPMSGWLANYFGRRRTLMVCVVGFGVTSVLCGLSQSLSGLIVCRVLQGLSGGGMQPLAQAIMLEAFPREKHGHAMAAYGVGVILAPILGPALGGWVTDNYSWRWIFYLNVPVGALSLVLISRFVFDPSYIRRTSKRVDLWGIGFLALGIGMLQVILDTGQRKDWFSSPTIRTWTVLCVAGLVLFVWRELTTREPIVDLRVLKDATYSAGVYLITMLGFILYASLVLLPIYLQTLLGYPAFQAGLAISPRGVGAILTTPIAGVLTHKVGPRKLLVFGLALGGFTMWQLAGLNLQAGYWDVFWPQVLQGVAMSFLFIPIMAAGMSKITKEKMGNATSIFNLMRNIGGSFGIAVMTTFLVRRGQVHQSHLVSNISMYDPETWQMLQAARAWFISRGADAHTAMQQAYGAIYGMVQRQAAMLSFVEAFWVMAVMFFLMIPFVFILRPPKHGKGEDVAVVAD
jgi:MFS transporter, DHA2 family, multidrug resistance protein